MIKLYHGSPKKLEIIKPQKAKGINEFQNQEAIFLTKNFDQAALYALAKSLKGKAKFALPPGEIIIVGNAKPSSKGFIYEVELDKKEVTKGNFGDYEFSYNKSIANFKVHEVKLIDYKNKIRRVESLEELKKIISKLIKN